MRRSSIPSPRSLGLVAVALVASLLGLAGLSENRAHDGESTAFLGVGIEEETEYAEGGARVSRVYENTAAERAGIVEGDIIVEFDGQTVRGPAGLTRRVRDRRPGERVEVTVVRDGREQSFEVELGKRAEHVRFGMPDGELNLEELEQLGESLEGLEGLEDLGERIHEGLAQIEICEDGDCRHLRWHQGNRPLLGVQLTDTTPELRTHLGGSENAGILVSKVLRDTPAEEFGIQVGDLIVAIDGEPIRRTGDIRSALREKSGQSVDVEVLRDRSPLTIRVAFPERMDDGASDSGSLLERGIPEEFRLPLRELERSLQESTLRNREEVRRSMEESRRLQREAARQLREQVRDVRHGAVHQAREALREARRLQREALREARQRLTLL